MKLKDKGADVLKKAENAVRGSSKGAAAVGPNARRTDAVQDLAPAGACVLAGGGQAGCNAEGGGKRGAINRRIKTVEGAPGDG